MIDPVSGRDSELKTMSPHSGWKLNFLQTNQRTHISVSHRGGGRDDPFFNLWGC